MAALSGKNLEVFMEYVAKNSYGADVVGNDLVRFTLDENGNFSQTK